jgi:hypothetical protein
MTDPQHRWLDTYNGALSGMYQNPQFVSSGPQYIHLQATLAADTAWGTYPPDEPPAEPEAAIRSSARASAK